MVGIIDEAVRDSKLREFFGSLIDRRQQDGDYWR